MYKHTTLLLLLMLSCAGFAAAPADPAEQRGLAIFTERDRLDQGYFDQRVEMEMILRSPGGREASRRIRLSQLEGPPGGGDKALILFEEPLDIKGTALLTHEALGSEDDAQWLYLPAYRRVKRIAAQDRSGRFVGTEFSYEDLAGDKLQDFRYRYLGEINHEGHQLQRVERIPLNPHSEYGRQETWVDPQNHQVVHALLYDRKGRHIKTFTADGWVQYEGRFWRPQRIIMTHVPSGRSTLLKTAEYQFDTGLTDNDFSLVALRRIR
jgi:hypothetical protein